MGIIKDYMKSKAVKLILRSGILGPAVLAGVFIIIIILLFLSMAAVNGGMQLQAIRNKMYTLDITDRVLNLCYNKHMEDVKIDFCKLLTYVCADKYFEQEDVEPGFIDHLAEQMQNDERKLKDEIGGDEVNEFKTLVNKAYKGVVGRYTAKEKRYFERKDWIIDYLKLQLKYHVTCEKDGKKIEVYLSKDDIKKLKEEGYKITYHLVRESEIVNTQKYGIRLYFPIPEGYKWTHYNDFGEDRSYGGDRKHVGNDIMAEPGTPVIAVESGEITGIGYGEISGYYITIKSKDRYYSYCHLDRFHPDSKKGEKIQAGSVIGYIGNTGYGPEVTRGKFPPHLHIQIGYKLKNCEEIIWMNPFYFMEFIKSHQISVHYKNGDYYTLEQE